MRRSISLTHRLYWISDYLTSERVRMKGMRHMWKKNSPVIPYYIRNRNY